MALNPLQKQALEAFFKGRADLLPAWTFYNSTEFPAEYRINFDDVTLKSDNDMLLLVASMLAAACAVARGIANGERSITEFTIGPMRVKESDAGAKAALKSLADLWCSLADQIRKQVEGAGKKRRRILSVHVSGVQGANPQPVFTIPKPSGGIDLYGVPYDIILKDRQSL